MFSKNILSPALVEDWIGRKVSLVSVDRFASSVYRSGLSSPLAVLPVDQAEEGDLLVCKVVEVNTSYPTLETTDGKEVNLRKGDVIVGVAGSRQALRGFSGKVPPRLSVGGRIYLLNKGGVIGECTAFHRDLGWPTQLEYLGTTHTPERRLNLRDFSLPKQEGPLPDVPVVMVAGTCMNSGKTSVCKQIIEMFSGKGFRINAGKVAGVACLQDLISMKQAGAREVLSFMDFGLPSTTGVESLAPVGRSLICELSKSKPDFIVLEMGDGILGGYQVASLFRDREFISRSLCVVLCANDLMGVWGGIQWFNSEGFRLGSDLRVLASGPVTDSQDGIHYIEEQLSLPAANAFDSAGKMCTLILEALMPWLRSE